MPDMNDESLYRLIVDDDGVECTDPAGVAVRVTWADLTEVVIVTTEVSLTAIDVWLELRTEAARCRVPQGAPGEKELLFDHCKAHFPNMNMRAISSAMSSVKDAEFRVWPPS
jgi:hypothetical protein